MFEWQYSIHLHSTPKDSIKHSEDFRNILDIQCLSSVPLSCLSFLRGGSSPPRFGCSTGPLTGSPGAPSSGEKGPARAIEPQQLLRFLDFFRNHIGDHGEILAVQVLNCMYFRSGTSHLTDPVQLLKNTRPPLIRKPRSPFFK